MAGAFSSRSTAESPCQSANRIPQVPRSLTRVPATTTFSARAPLSTFPWILLFPHNTSSNSTMVLPNPSQLQKWLHSFRNHGRCHPIRLISFLPSFVLTPRSRLSTRVSIIKVTSLKPRTVPTASVTSRTSTRNNPTGLFPYPISHLIGKTCV